MAKDESTPSQSVSELNTCVSTGHRTAAKEATFREWMDANQIGMRPISNLFGLESIDGFTLLQSIA